MSKAVTNQTYSFSPQAHSIFNTENLDPSVKVQTIPTSLQGTKPKGLKGGKQK